MSFQIEHRPIVFTQDAINLYRDLLRDGVHSDSEDSLLEYRYRKAIAEERSAFVIHVVAKAHDRYVGFAGADAEGLLQIYVKSPYRLNGIGNQLMMEAKKHATAAVIELSAIVTNANHKLCRRHGITYPKTYQPEFPTPVGRTMRI